MYDDGIMNCWIINELSSEYAPYERYQVLIWNSKEDAPDRYQYFPKIPKNCEIAAQPISQGLRRN